MPTAGILAADLHAEALFVAATQQGFYQELAIREMLMQTSQKLKLNS